MKKQSVHIIGGGPAGLSAAHELAQKSDREVVVYEKRPHVGGISRTEVHNGYYFDIGGHRFFTKNKRIHKLWKEILGEKFIKVNRVSSIIYKGKCYNYPLRLTNTFTNLGLTESVRIIWSYLRSALFPTPEEETFDKWVTNRFGRRLYTIFFKTYTEKVWGIPCSTIQADWASQRIQGLSLKEAAVNAITGSHTSKTLIDEFDYPVRGAGMMWEGLRDAIQKKGGSVTLNCEIVSIHHAGTRITAIELFKNQKRQSVSVENLISSAPITRLISLLDPPPGKDVIDAANHLVYRSFIIVLLVIQKKDLFDEQWIYVHTPEVKVGRIQNFKNWSFEMVPDPNTTSLGFEYFCNEGDDLWALDESELAKLAAREFERLGFGSSSLISDSCVTRQPNAYPVYTEAQKENLELIKNYLCQFENLQTVGRNGMHRFNNMDHSMITGIMAARNLQGENNDLWAVNEEKEYIESGKT